MKDNEMEHVTSEVTAESTSIDPLNDPKTKWETYTGTPESKYYNEQVVTGKINTNSTAVADNLTQNTEAAFVQAVNRLCKDIHQNNVDVGWYTDINTGKRIDRNIPEMLALIHSEISEGLEGYRKSLKDDHLPQYDMLTVELADAVIRICDLCGYKNLPLGDAIRDKLAYNKNRADHKIENRLKEGGKIC